MEKENNNRELPFLMKKWSLVCFLIFLASSVFVYLSGGSDNYPFTGTFFCEYNKDSRFVILNPPERFHVNVDSGENFTVFKDEINRYKNIPYKYDLEGDRVIIHALSPLKDTQKLAKVTTGGEMGSATVEKIKGGRLKYSIRYDKPFTFARSEYVVDGNEVVNHYDYENSSFMLLFPMVFAFVLLYYIGKFLIKIYEKFHLNRL